MKIKSLSIVACGFLFISITLSIASASSYSQAASIQEKMSYKSQQINPEDNCVLYLLFDENRGNDAKDWSGWGNDGTLYNFDFNEDSGWVYDEVRGWSLKFDGVDDHIKVPDSPSLRINEQITIEAWVKVSRVDNDQIVVAKGYDYILNIWGTNRFRPGVVEVGGIDPSGKEHWLPGYTPVDDNEWHHIAFTYDGSTMKIWIDGKLSAERHEIFTFRTTTTPVYIGSMIGTHRFLNGLVDEVRIYNMTLTEAELFSKSWFEILFPPPNLVLLALACFLTLVAIVSKKKRIFYVRS